MKWEKNNYHLKQLATGDTLSVNTYTVTGDEPGPHVHIQASVHGAELQGNAVILKLMDALKGRKLKGSITFVPLCNPYGTNQKIGTYTYGRFNPVTGDNWNRNFFDIIKKTNCDVVSFAQEHLQTPWPEVKTIYKEKLGLLYEEYERQLRQNGKLSDNITFNLHLQKLASKADGILDFHTGPTATRYLYSAEYEVAASRSLLFRYTLVIPNDFAGAMDESGFMPWIHLKNAFEKLGRKIDLDVDSFTLEFGSEETFNMEWAQKDVLSVLNYLTYKGLLEGEVQKMENYQCKLKDYVTIFAPRGGLVDYLIKPGDHFKKGDVLAKFYQMKDLDPENPLDSCCHDLKATTDGIIINLCPSSSVHEGMELFQIMINAQKFD